MNEDSEQPSTAVTDPSMFQQMFECFPGAIFIRTKSQGDHLSRLSQANAKACDRLGYSQEELRRMSFLDIAPEISERRLSTLEQQLSTDGNVEFETRLRTKTGRFIPVQMTEQGFKWKDQQLVCSVARDSRSPSKSAADESIADRPVQEMMETMQPISVTLDRQGAILFANPFLLKLTGCTREEVLGKNWFTTQVLANLDNITSRKKAERELKESEETFRQLAENIRQVFWISSNDTGELVYVSPSYEEIWGRSRDSLYADPISFTETIHAEDRDKVLKALAHQKKGGGYDVEYRIIRPDGSVRWIHDQGFAVRNERGEFYRSIGLADDITNRKTLEDQFRQAQKMEAVGQLAGGVAHDFNNILSAILLHLGVLRQNPQIAAEVKESLQDLETEAVRASGLTRQLLLFSRREVARVEPLVVEELIKGLLKMLRRLLGENVEMDFVASTIPSCVEADPGMLEQVVMNLCVNARDAMPNGGKITLRTSLIAIDRKSPNLHPDSYESRFMCLEVTDTGCGMEENVLKRMFEPFFTTKEAGKGTGLGLATVYGIVKQHRGWTQVESEVGKGTTFRVYIPVFCAPVPALKPKVVEKDLPGGTETVLLVEDDAALRRVTTMCLQKLGYTVIEANDGADALQKWAGHKSNIDLLLTDMVMPETITGLDLTQRLQVDNPKLKAIISSGYSSELVKPQVLKKGILFLAKPYRPSVLSKIVRQCLDGGKCRHS